MRVHANAGHSRDEVQNIPGRRGQDREDSKREVPIGEQVGISDGKEATAGRVK